MDDRTVANELQNGSTQSSLACKSCRRKKLKCDRTFPTCRNCHKASRNCDYPEVAQKPGPRPGTHRRSQASPRTSANKNRFITTNGSPTKGTPNFSNAHNTSTALETHRRGSDSVDGHSSYYASDAARSPELTSLSAHGSPFSIACGMMHISEHFCFKMIEAYFENMTAFSLFHQPTFMKKLASIHDAKQLQVLLTTMLAFSIRFMKGRDLEPDSTFHHSTLLDSAYDLGQECLKICADEAPPLHVLQALLLQALYLSHPGVRGRAYRLVGLCIRIAYELRLHEVDIDIRDNQGPLGSQRPSPSAHFISSEEKRRLWWAIWECDVFASTILRLPNGVDWTRNRTCLPAPDEVWFDGIPYRSCYLHVNPNKRWRALRDTGNVSPDAWFVLLNSYKWEALSISQRIAPPTTFFDRDDHLGSTSDPSDWKPILARKREMLENCLRCALSAIPHALRPDGYLSFEPSRGRYTCLSRMTDSGIYCIHMMSQIVQLLFFRKDIEGGELIPYPADFSQHPPPSANNNNHDNNATTHSNAQHPTPPTETPQQQHQNRKRWQRALQAADQMVQIVRTSSPTHYRHLNANMATALWMGAATQLAVLAYHRDEVDIELVQSNLDVLTTTIDSFTEFWDLPKTLTQSLAMLQERLKTRKLGAGQELQQHNQQQQQYQPESDVQKLSYDTTTTTTPINSIQNGDHGPNTAAINGILGFDQTQTNVPDPNTNVADMLDTVNGSIPNDLSPFDVLQAMDFGAMYNGVENWENLFLDPGFALSDIAFQR